ncbi:fibrinolytic enzyme, isozyme C-like [Saccostrea echinata]|uniref:fibrinolytic enzyme, isozyme C-like n=1 Tax=Saccostrea echinata TaxID=191078 RepID=UPI002A822031|nr:fibrinolytic enzyme, isozyme C-like [Saccostrea echinata]
MIGLILLCLVFGVTVGEELKAVQPGREPPVYDFNTRVVGGSNANIADWPWQASLRYNGGHTCGAIIISPNYLLTAAHCVNGRIYSLFDIEVGSSNRGGGTVYKLSSITEHSGYSGSSAGFPNDIAILRVQGNLVFSDTVQAAKLPSDRYYNHNSHECYITGWGKIRGNQNSLPTTLQEAMIPAISNSECATRMSGINGAAIYDQHTCNFDAYASTNACQGDSGGPMACRASSSDDFVAVGIASWVITGCSGSYPSVYVRIAYYLDWLISNGVPL